MNSLQWIFLSLVCLIPTVVSLAVKQHGSEWTRVDDVFFRLSLVWIGVLWLNAAAGLFGWW